jgi:hypothetical protein
MGGGHVRGPACACVRACVRQTVCVRLTPFQHVSLRVRAFWRHRMRLPPPPPHAHLQVTPPFWRDTGTVRTTDPRNVEHILKTNFRNYVKSDRLRRAMLELIGDGIFRINHGALPSPRAYTA